MIFFPTAYLLKFNVWFKKYFKISIKILKCFDMNSTWLENVKKSTFCFKISWVNNLQTLDFSRIILHFFFQLVIKTDHFNIVFQKLKFFYVLIIKYGFTVMFLTDLFDRFKGVFEKNIFTVHHVLFFTEDIHVCAFDTNSLRQNLK